MKTNQAQTATTEVTTKVEYDLSGCTTTSAKIRKLTSLNLDRGTIAKYLGVRYQHVRNVQITPIKKELVRK